MADMFDNLKAGRGIRGNPKGDDDHKAKPWWVPGAHETNCSQCGGERATGSIKMSDGSWKKIGPSCRKNMGVKPSDKRGNGVGHTGSHSPDSKPYSVGQPKVKQPIRVESKRLDK